jgi:predicted nucleic acid-binding protein
MAASALVLDANILIRAILGARVPHIIKQHLASCRFWIAQPVLLEARTHLPRILTKRGRDFEVALAALDGLVGQMDVIERGAYGVLEENAELRLKKRDLDDWPTAAVSLLFDCPIFRSGTTLKTTVPYMDRRR